MEPEPKLILTASSAYSLLIPVLIHVCDGFMWARAMDSKTLGPWEGASKSPKILFINTDAQVLLSDIGIQDIWDEILESALNITKNPQKPLLIA